MYPDLNDVSKVLSNLNLASKPEDIWSDVVLLRGFIEQARRACRNHGRSAFGLVSELKTMAESFVGRSVSDNALAVAMKLLGLEVKPSGKDKQLIVKLPPLQKFEERRDAWNLHLKDVEQRKRHPETVLRNCVD